MNTAILAIAVRQVSRIGFPAGILVLGLAIALLVGLVLLLINQRTRKMGVILLLIPVLGILAILFMRLQMRIPSPRANAPISLRQSVVEPAVVWSEGIERQFQADIYPSKEQAAYALGQAVARTLQKKNVNDSVTLYIDDAQVEKIVGGQMMTGILDRASAYTILLYSSLSQDQEMPKDAKLVPIIVASSENSPSHPDVLAAEIRWNQTEEDAVLATIQYKDVPWLTRTAAYLNQPKHQHHTVVYSTESCNSVTEARQQAMREAQRYLNSILRTDNAVNLTVNQQDLTQYKFIADSFTQSFQGTAGLIWRQALLLDIAPGKLDRLIHAKIVDRRAVHKTWAQYLGSALGLGLLILILYIFLNAATRGYYTWTLRIVAVIAIGVIILVVLNYA